MKKNDLVAVGSCAGAAVLFGVAVCQNYQRRRIEQLLSHPTSYSVADYEHWTARDVAGWLASQGLPPDVACLFVQHHVDGRVLQMITESSLVQMGINLVGDRLKVIGCIKDLQRAVQTPSAPTAAKPQEAPAPQAQRAAPAAAPSAESKKGASPRTTRPRTAQEEELDRQLEAQKAQRDSVLKERERIIAELEAKYSEAVASHISSLQDIHKYLLSPNFREAPPLQRRKQLESVIGLLSGLLEAANDLPEEHGKTLVACIKRVHEVVGVHEEIIKKEILEGATERKSANGTKAKKEGPRMKRLRELKNELETTDNIEGLGDIMEVVMEDAENLEDVEEMKLLKEIVDLLQAKNEKVKKQAEGLREAQKKTPQAKKLQTLIDLITSKEGFASLSPQEKAEVLTTSYQLLQNMSDNDRYENAALVSHLLKVTKAKQQEVLAEVEKESKKYSQEADTQGEENGKQQIDHEPDEDDEPIGVVSELLELTQVPKIYGRLSSPDFAETTSRFELECMLWITNQASHVLAASDVLGKDCSEVVGTVKELLTLRMQTFEGGGVALPSGQVKITKDGDGKYTVLPTKTEGTTEDSVIVPNPIPVTSGPTPKAFRALLLATVLPDGTEGLEVKQLAYFLRKYQECECTVLVGVSLPQLKGALGDLRREAEEEDGLRTLIHYRSNFDGVTPGCIKLQDGNTVTLDWLLEQAPEEACVVLDNFDECVFATAPKNVVRLAVDEDSIRRIDVPCNTIFEGFFTVLMMVLLCEGPRPQSLLSLIHHIQRLLIGGEAYEFQDPDKVETALANTLLFIEQEDDDKTEQIDRED